MLLCATSLLLAGQTLSYRLEATADGLVSRGLLGTTRIAWREVSRVEQGPDVIVVWGAGDSQIRIGTSGFRPEQRASLDRTMTRRLREETHPPPSSVSGPDAAVPRAPARSPRGP